MSQESKPGEEESELEKLKTWDEEMAHESQDIVQRKLAELNRLKLSPHTSKSKKKRKEKKTKEMDLSNDSSDEGEESQSSYTSDTDSSDDFGMYDADMEDALEEQKHEKKSKEYYSSDSDSDVSSSAHEKSMAKGRKRKRKEMESEAEGSSPPSKRRRVEAPSAAPDDMKDLLDLVSDDSEDENPSFTQVQQTINALTAQTQASNDVLNLLHEPIVLSSDDEDTGEAPAEAENASDPTTDTASPATEEEPLTLRVPRYKKPDKFFTLKVLPSQTFEAIIAELERRLSIKVRFTFDGEDIQADDTPLKLEMEDGDMIDAYYG